VKRYDFSWEVKKQIWSLRKPKGKGLLGNKKTGLSLREREHKKEKEKRRKKRREGLKKKKKKKRRKKRREGLKKKREKG